MTFAARDPARAAQIETARQSVVEPETGRVVRQLPVTKRGHQELSSVDQVRGVLEQQRTLVQCLANKWDIALRQISHSAMNELGAAAGGSVREVARFQEQGAVAAGGGIDGRAQSRCAAADDKDVPRLTRRSRSRFSVRDKDAIGLDARSSGESFPPARLVEPAGDRNPLIPASTVS